MNDKPKGIVVKFNTYDKNNVLRPETFVWLCNVSDIIGETERALLVTIGYTRARLPIEAYVPKSTIVLKEDKEKGITRMYAPLNIVRSKGVGWHIPDNGTLPNGYIKYENSHYDHALATPKKQIKSKPEEYEYGDEEEFDVWDWDVAPDEEF